jgi:hypothetical protein
MKTKSEKKNILFINSNRSIIDLDPTFQRGKVWSGQKQQLFIDTLLKGWGIPKIYLAAYKDRNNKIYRYECIDGKQRLTAIFDFFDNKIALIDSRNKFYRNLDLDIKEKIGGYLLDIEIAEDFEEERDELSELFQRLQSGLALNTSEKLKAIPGDMSAFVYELSNKKLFAKKIQSKAKRNPHLATVAQAALLSTKNDFANLKFGDLQKFFNTYRKFNTNGEEARKIKKILKYIDLNFSEKEAREVFTNRAIFISCFYLISFLMLRGDISKLKIKDFFISFAKRLASKEKDASLKDFQISVIQGADSSAALKKRHKILVDAFIKFDKNVAPLLNHETLDEEFRSIYKMKLKLFAGEHKKLNVKLLSMNCRLAKLANGKSESMPVYIRHQNEHPNKKRKYKYTHDDLVYSVKMLRKIK